MSITELETTIDLDAYLQRIGYTGGREPTLETLQALITHHTQTIPFENLNPLLKRPVNIGLESLQEKIVHNGRGGYCFEQNGLFSPVLKALGFHVTNLAGRVVWGRPDDAPAALTHMVLRIDIDGQPYIADVGFGGMTLPSPIRLELNVAQETTHEPYRLLEKDGVHFLQALVQNEWRTLYRFTLQTQQPIDYEMGNWFVSTYPQSHFVTTLGVARLAPGRRYALRNNQFSIHHLGRESEIRTLADVEEVLDVLQEVMGLTLPEGWGLAERVQELITE